MRTTVAAVVLAAALAACGESADQLLETAAFEEIQNNPAHARQLYERILRDHPDTPQAKTAAEKLRALAAKQK
jgi:TolA-binding protein